MNRRLLIQTTVGHCSRTVVAAALVATAAAAAVGGSSHRRCARSPRRPRSSRCTPSAVRSPRSSTPQGRQVILRGVNVNSLGDYYQDDRRLPPVVPVTAKDWDSHGRARLRRRAPARELVQARAAAGADRPALPATGSTARSTRRSRAGSTASSTCTRTRGASTSRRRSTSSVPRDASRRSVGTVRRSGRRSPTARTPALPARASTRTAVLTAWDSFYANRNGIQDHLVSVWGRIAREFRTDPAVAGYDLLNEPNHGHHDAQATVAARWARTTRSRSQAIRAAETGAASLHHIVFFEATVFGVPVLPGFTTDAEHRVRAAQLRRVDRRHPDRGPLRLLRQPGQGLRRPRCGRASTAGSATRPRARRSSARFAADRRLDDHRGRDVVAVAPGLWRPALHRPSRRQAGPGARSTSSATAARATTTSASSRVGVHLAAVPARVARSPRPHCTAGCTGDLQLAGHDRAPGTIDVWYPGSVRPDGHRAPASPRSCTRRRRGGSSVTDESIGQLQGATPTRRRDPLRPRRRHAASDPTAPRSSPPAACS